MENISKVAITKDMLVIPTAGMGFDDPNTSVEQVEGFAADCAYPCTFHKHFLRDELVDKEYERITFENEFLIVEFIPELGGRVWRIYDKIHQREVIHKNDCVKSYLGGFGGAYTAGGIELDYPFAHAITNMFPRKTEYHQNPDGSATYIVSEWERVGRTDWCMEFTLCPGENRLKQTVKAYNRSKLPLSFHYWGNAGVPLNLDTKWIYKETMGSEHGGSSVYLWPEYKGVDLSWYKNDCEVVGIYFLEPKYNFFGLLDAKNKTGLVHYADRHDLPGKKLWTWGVNNSGVNRAYHLSKEPHYYGETQSGRIVNQEHFEWLMPEEYISWNEQWCPVYGLTDVTETTENCAFQLDAESKKLSYFAFVSIQDQKLVVKLDGEILKEIPFSAKAAEFGEIDLSFLKTDRFADLKIEVVKGEILAGVIELERRCARKTAGEIREEPIFDNHSSMALFACGEFSHKGYHRAKARQEYEKSVELDKYNYKARTGLGRLLFGMGLIDEAKASFQKALDIYKWDTEAYLMLSHIATMEGKIDEAMEYALSARYYGDRCRSNRKLAELSINKKQYHRALEFLQQAIQNNQFSYGSHVLTALTERKLGNNAQAVAKLESLKEEGLKDIMWFSEMWFAGQISKDQMVEGLFSDEWRFLELALNYTELGLYEEAEKLLDVAITLHPNGWKVGNVYNPERVYGIWRKRENPFLHMLKGYIAVKEGRTEDAKKYFKDGDYFEYYVDFNQVDLEPVVRMAIENGNAAASHYLGDYLFHNLRYEEAKDAWEAADKSMADCSVNTRDLGVYARFIEKDPQKAVELYRKACQQNPNDIFLRHERINAENEVGTEANEILRINLEQPEAQKQTSGFMGILGAYVKAKRFDECIEFLKNAKRDWFDEEAGWHWFCVNYGEYLIDENQPEKAAEWLQKAIPNPKNLSYVNYPEEYIYRYKELYLTGLAFKNAGNKEKADEYFLKTINRPADLYYFKPWEDMINQQRFYIALAMKDYGMESAARVMMGGINTYRETRGLIALQLDKNEINRWGDKDPDAVISYKEQTGPEI